jgi:phenylalanyl-tRNA synthetase alpha chain
MSAIDDVRSQATTDISSVTSLKELEPLQIKYMGRNGRVNELMQELKTIPAEHKKQFGQDLNALKKEIEQKLLDRKNELLKSSEETSTIDVTLPGTRYPKGSLHFTTYAIEEIAKIFEKLGFIRMSYPEVEYEFFSFDALNMRADHPARDDFETFFIDSPPHKEYGKMVLTPHTSSGQHREMKRLGKPPIRMINIAKTYRPNWDASHVPMFHQFEGMCVDEGINITHLKGVIDHFAKEFFGPDRQIRLRPYHFQFTEPSFEVDISCGVCGGTGKVNDQKCKICKQGWLELGGAGMMHPNVLKDGGIDPSKYTGFAFGWGVERTFAMKEGLNLDDIRILYSGDIRFLEQF